MQLTGIQLRLNENVSKEKKKKIVSDKNPQLTKTLKLYHKFKMGYAACCLINLKM